MIVHPIPPLYVVLFFDAVFKNLKLHYAAKNGNSKWNIKTMENR